jgi:ribosomal protein S18 acetylase RimI-like enzyme
MSFNFRQAGISDKNFVINAIIEAEKSGTDVISYCAIFRLSEEELRELLGKILDEHLAGQELYLPGFLVAETGGEAIATMSAWIEKEEGMSSNMIKSNLFMYFLDRNKLLSSMAAIEAVNEVNIDRTEGALQIECVYTHPGHRGKGIAAQLIDEQIKWKREKGNTFSKVQIALMGNNQAAIRAYEKAGFCQSQSKSTDNPVLIDLLSCDTKILMERIINN